VLAQQLLFRTTPAGDLTVYLAHFFDTKIGIKTDAEKLQENHRCTCVPAEKRTFYLRCDQRAGRGPSGRNANALCVRSEGTNLSQVGIQSSAHLTKSFPDISAALS